MRLASLREPTRARDRRVAFVLLCILLVGVALLLVVKSPGTPIAVSSPAPRGPRTPSRAPARGLDLERASAIARHFLHGYLSVVYGQAAARALPNAAPGIVARIAGRRRVPPELRRLHPRVVSVISAPDGEGPGIEVTARIGDGEVLTYPLRLLLARSRRGRLVVVKVGEG